MEIARAELPDGEDRSNLITWSTENSIRATKDEQELLRNLLQAFVWHRKTMGILLLSGQGLTKDIAVFFLVLSALSLSLVTCVLEKMNCDIDCLSRMRQVSSRANSCPHCGNPDIVDVRGDEGEATKPRCQTCGSNEMVAVQIREFSAPGAILSVLLLVFFGAIGARMFGVVFVLGTFFTGSVETIGLGTILLVLIALCVLTALCFASREFWKCVSCGSVVPRRKLREVVERIER